MNWCIVVLKDTVVLCENGERPLAGSGRRLFFSKYVSVLQSVLYYLQESPKYQVR